MSRRLTAYPMMVLAGLVVAVLAAAFGLDGPARDGLTAVACVVLVASVFVWSERLPVRALMRSAQPSRAPARSAGRPRAEIAPRPRGRRGGGSPTFGVVALGHIAAGKTVYLSALFHALNAPSEERPYYVTTDADTTAELVGNHALVASGNWPRATPPGRYEVLLDIVAHDHRDRPRTVMRISSLDYAGEQLSSIAGDDEFNAPGRDDWLATQVRRADALLGLIDGDRVLRFIHGDADGIDYVERRLPAMFDLMNLACGPVQLVLTKWDLLQDTGVSADADDRQQLERVIDALMSTEAFSAFVRARGAQQRLRLIPVSAVGHSGAVGADQEPGLSAHAAQATDLGLPLATVLTELIAEREGRDPDVIGSTSYRVGSGFVELRRLRRIVIESFRTQTDRLDKALPAAILHPRP